MAYSLVDVSGPSGSAGKNGVNAPISSAAWGNGSDGGDAGNPTIGGNGGGEAQICFAERLQSLC